MSENLPWVTADSLIESFGDQAYHKGTGMFVEMVALTPDDFDAIAVVRKACVDLMVRGYHKKEKSV